MINSPAVLLFSLLFLSVSNWVSAQELMIARSSLEFPETMSNLQNYITDHGYTVSRIQKVDEGLQKHGFERENYKVVFFGKADEIRTLSDHYPELSVFLPLNFVVFAENGKTVVATLNPAALKYYFKSAEIQQTLERWEADLYTILDNIGSD